jgi:hypothetical protein
MDGVERAHGVVHGARRAEVSRLPRRAFPASWLTARLSHRVLHLCRGVAGGGRQGLRGRRDGASLSAVACGGTARLNGDCAAQFCGLPVRGPAGVYARVPRHRAPGASSRCAASPLSRKRAFSPMAPYSGVHPSLRPLRTSHAPCMLPAPQSRLNARARTHRHSPARQAGPCVTARRGVVYASTVSPPPPPPCGARDCVQP